MNPSSGSWQAAYFSANTAHLHFGIKLPISSDKSHGSKDSDILPGPSDLKFLPSSHLSAESLQNFKFPSGKRTPDKIKT
jgi:hypothetical protein